MVSRPPLDGWEAVGLPSLHNERLTEQVRDEVVRLYLETDLSVVAIGKRLDIPRATVYWVLKQRGVPQGVRGSAQPVASTDMSLELLNARMIELGAAMRDELIEHGRVLGRIEALTERLESLERRVSDLESS